MLEYGKAIGHFHECLSDLDKNKINNIIEDVKNNILIIFRLEFFSFLLTLLNEKVLKFATRREDSIIEVPMRNLVSVKYSGL